MKVSEELKKYRPMTISEIVALLCDQLAPFLFVAATSIVLLVAVACFRCGFTANGVLSSSISLFGLGLTTILFFRKKSVVGAVSEYLERKKGYWMIYVVNTIGNDHAVFGPLTEAAMHEQLKTLHEGEGLHFVVPLFDGKNADGEEGFVFVGKKNPHPRLDDEAFDRIQRELPWWKVLPVFLSSYWSELGDVRIALKDRYGEVSPGLSIQDAAQFIRSAPIGWLGDGYNNWPMALKAMMDRQAKLVADLGRTLPVLIRAAHDLHSDGRTLLTPRDMIVAEKPIVELLVDLLAPYDPRRRDVDFSPKPIPDIEPAANKPPSPDGAPSASGDDGHCCCSGS